MLTPNRHKSRKIITLNGTKQQSMAVFRIAMDSLDRKTRERIEITGNKMPEFATVRQPNMNDLEFKYEHAQDVKIYVKPGNECRINVGLGDSTYCKINTENITKGSQESLFWDSWRRWSHHWPELVCDRDEWLRKIRRAKNRRPRGERSTPCPKADQGWHNEARRCTIWSESIRESTLDSRQYSGKQNGQASRKRHKHVNKKLIQKKKLKEEYEKIVNERLRVVERVPNMQAESELSTCFISLL